MSEQVPGQEDGVADPSGGWAPPRDLLTVNKQVINRGLDLMGRSLLQETAVTQDVLGRLAPGAEEFWEVAARDGVKQAVAERDAPFADGDPIE